MTRVSTVRGLEVSFNAAAIESFLATHHPVGGVCDYTNLYNRLQPSPHGLYRDEVPHLAELLRVGITRPHSKWILKGHGIPEKLGIKELNAECRFWHHFVNANILPSTNLTDVNVERAALLYSITGEERVDIASVISDRICHMVKVSRTRGMLGFASLINQLSSRAGVEIPDFYHDHEGILDVPTATAMTWDNFVSAQAGAEMEFNKRAAKAGGRQPSPRPPRIPLPPPPEEPPADYADDVPPAAPVGFGFYAMQQQLAQIAEQNASLAAEHVSLAAEHARLAEQNSYLAAQNATLIRQGDYTHRFLEHAYPHVPYQTFPPVYPEGFQAYDFPQFPPQYPPAPAAPAPVHPAAASSSYAARRVVLDDDDSDEDRDDDSP